MPVKAAYLYENGKRLAEVAHARVSLLAGFARADDHRGIQLGEINALHKPHVEQASFAVLKAPDMPSILVETAFITNPYEEAKLKSDAHRAKVAEAVFQGIKRYFAKNPPLAPERVVLAR